MAPAPPHSSKRSRQQPKKKHAANLPRTAASSPEVVDPLWLAKAAGIVIVAALVCGYLTLCLLFYQGQWQLVLHPTRTSTAPLAIEGTQAEAVRFGVDESGIPQLTGWWIPADQTGRYAAKTILYLPSGDGSLTDAQTELNVLHALGINLFAFDYRGYGQSAAVHPDERRMTQDALSAWDYLTVSRKISANQIVPFGQGVGASLAAQLASSHQQVPGVILLSPKFDLLANVERDPRVRLLPVRMLFHNRFELTEPVAGFKTPKLFLLDQNEPGLDLARSAPSPKTVVALPAPQLKTASYGEQISRFLDQL